MWKLRSAGLALQRRGISGLTKECVNKKSARLEGLASSRADNAQRKAAWLRMRGTGGGEI